MLRRSRAGNGFVAGHQGHDAVKHVAARHQFDRIRDHLAAHQRRLHAFGAHGDAVADSDGVELHGRAARGAHPFLHFHRQFPQVVIAVHGLGPCVRNADDRLFQVRIGESDGFEVRPCRRAITALRNGVAVEFHGNLSSYLKDPSSFFCHNDSMSGQAAMAGALRMQAEWCRKRALVGDECHGWRSVRGRYTITP